MRQTWLDYLVIIIYFIVVLAIGLWCARGEKSTENYLLGGRKMPYVAVGIACIMALFSSITLVQVPGEIYNHGLTLFILSSTVGAFLAIPAYLMFVRFYFRLGSFTPYEYLEYRYDATVRGIVAAAAFYGRLMYLAMVLYTTAKIFEGAYHWPAWFSILLVGVIGIIYTVKGGAKAVVWTDVMQFFVLFGSFIAIMIVLCCKIDGGAFEAVRRALADGHGCPQFTQAEFYSLSPYVRLLFWLMLIGIFVSALTSGCSDQISIQRYLSCKNWKDGFKAQIITTCLGFVTTLIMFFVGLAVYTYYAQNPEIKATIREGDHALFEFVSNNMPTPLPGLFIAGMLAAIMSTLSAGTNSMATIWLKEFHVKFINRNLDDAGQMRVSKLATLYIGIFMMVMAMGLVFSGKWLSQSVSEVGTIFGILGAAVLPAFLAAVLSPRANGALIWGYTAYSFGESLGWNTWYAMSRTSEQAYYAALEAGEKIGFGWAGKLEFKYLFYAISATVILMLPVVIFKKYRKTWKGKLHALVALAMAGYMEGILVWYLYSNAMITDEPRARSFAFGLPISLIGVLIILRFCPKQPREKWQGLTLSTINEPLLVGTKEKPQE